MSYLPNPREDQLHPRKFGICLLSLLAGSQTPQVISMLKRHSYNALGLPKALDLLTSKVRYFYFPRSAASPPWSCCTNTLFFTYAYHPETEWLDLAAVWL